MPDEESPNARDDEPIDLTSFLRDRADRKQRDPDRAAHRKAAPEGPERKRRGPSPVGPEPPDEPAVPQEALDREQIELDRRQTELDRDQTAVERSADPDDEGEPPREQTGLDREQAVLDRDQARLGRAQAALDRQGTQRRDYLIDDLTGALLRGPGLRELQHEIDRARREGDPLVVAFIDVNGLKAVNDERGHAAGDLLLRDVADALRQGLRSYDLVLRYGGDEFVCALSNSEIDPAHGRLREVADILGAAPSRGSIAWGLAELRTGDTLEDIVARADRALSTARRGRRRAPAE